MRRIILGLVLLLAAGSVSAGNFVVEWTEVVWEGGEVRYEVGLGTESRVYTTIEPSTDGRHGFNGLECVNTFVAVRTCPADPTSEVECSEWSTELQGLPTIAQNAFCVPDVVITPPPPMPTDFVRTDVS